MDGNFWYVTSFRKFGLKGIAFLKQRLLPPTEIQALAFTTEASKAYMSGFRRDGGSVKAQLDQRDTTFGDYRTKKG